MSINSVKEQEIIERLEETVPACSFAFIHWDSNIGESGELYSTGQIGNVTDDGFQNQLDLLAMQLLMIENHYDTEREEILNLAMQKSELIKNGQFPGSVNLDLDMDRPPETVDD